jgi:membrane associated rhomboid family serine protease
MSIPTGPWQPPVAAPTSSAPQPGYPVVIDRRPGPVASFFFVGTWLAFMWLLEGVDALTGGALDSLGVSPRDVTELPQIFTAPFLHFGFAHLIANSVPFLVLGTLTRMAGRREFWIATLSSIVVSGLVTWLISAPMSVTGGRLRTGLRLAGLPAAARAVRTQLGSDPRSRGRVRVLRRDAVGCVPDHAGVSWQAHLGGVLGGALAAWWLHRRPRGAR